MYLLLRYPTITIYCTGATCDIEGELQDLINFANKTNSNKKSSMKDTLRAVLHPSALKPFVILALYFLVYQFSGVNPVTFYAVEIIQVLGHFLIYTNFRDRNILCSWTQESVLILIKDIIKNTQTILYI